MGLCTDSLSYQSDIGFAPRPHISFARQFLGNSISTLGRCDWGSPFGKRLLSYKDSSTFPRWEVGCRPYLSTTHDGGYVAKAISQHHSPSILYPPDLKHRCPTLYTGRGPFLTRSLVTDSSLVVGFRQVPQSP